MEHTPRPKVALGTLLVSLPALHTKQNRNRKKKKSFFISKVPRGTVNGLNPDSPGWSLSAAPSNNTKLLP